MTAKRRAQILESALRMISTAGSGDDPLMDAYREAGGGYAGLQAIAVKALELAEVDRTSPHYVPPEVRRSVTAEQFAFLRRAAQGAPHSRPRRAEG